MKPQTKFLVALLSSVFCLLSFGSFAQQLPFNNQYLINKFSLSPALAGHDGNIETFISYRRNLLGIQGAPETQTFNINTALNSKMGIGGNISSYAVGIFKDFSASLSYAYMLNISEKQSLSFGLSGELLNHHIDLSSIKTQTQSDPVVLSNQEISKTLFNADVGVAYHFQNFTAGVVSQQLLENNMKSADTGNIVLYTLKRHYLIHLSYLYECNTNWQVEPFVVMRKTENSPLFYEAAALVKYQKLVWLGATYRKGNSFGVSVGGAYKKAVLNYTFEFSGQGIQGASSGTHEISIGFLLGKSKRTSPSIFSNPDVPYYNWKK